MIQKIFNFIKGMISLTISTCLIIVLFYAILIGKALLPKEVKHSIPDYYYFNGSVNTESAEDFKQFLLMQPEGRNVYIDIETWGGLVVSLHKIIYYMNKSKAVLNCSVDSMATSAGALMLLSCDNIRITPDAEIMFHMYQTCTKLEKLDCIERGPVTHKNNPYNYKQSLKYMEIAKPYLTEKEWKDLIDGKDVYITGEELMKRIKDKQNGQIK